MALGVTVIRGLCASRVGAVMLASVCDGTRCDSD